MIELIKAKIGSNKHIKEIVKGGAFTFLAQIAGTALGLISSLIIARYYGANIIGIISIINSVLVIFTTFGLMGTDVAILRLVPEYLEKYSISEVSYIYKKVLLIVIGLSTLGSLVLYFSTSSIATKVFNNESLIPFFFIGTPFVLIRTMSRLNSEALRGLQKIKLYALIQFLPSVITVLLLIFLTNFFYDKYNPIYIMFTTNFIIFVILLYIVYKLFLIKDTRHSKISTSNIISLSFPMFLTSVMHLLIGQSDILMLGIMLNEHEVGIYSIVLKLATLTSFILIAVNSMAAPKFSQLYHSGKINELKIVAQSSAKLIFYSTLPIILIYIFAGFYILKIYGDEFTQGYYALIFLAIGQFVNAAAGSVGYFLDMTGSQKQFQYIVIIGAGINIILNLILIPKYGINGAAIASMISIAFWNITAAVLIKRKYGFYISYFPFTSIKKGLL